MGTLQIISTSSEPFNDRIEAGKLLACHLEKYRDHEIVVLGIPRGGVIVADRVARSLEADLDIVLSHKLGAPANPELAIGAVCEDGTVFVDKKLAHHVGADEDYIAQEKARQHQEIVRKVRLYRQILPKLNLKQKQVIVTDDGVATGATMQAALWAVQQEKPEKIIVALPVGPKETLTKLSQTADETICLKVPLYFGALGQFYVNFTQVEDEQLLEILRHKDERISKE